jgi:hypothetical protein
LTNARKPTPPSEGERRALTGFMPQYALLAEMAYSLLTSPDFEFVRILDPTALKLDDFQLFTRGRTDAFQVKWAKYPATMTVGAFFGQSKDTEGALIRQMALSWKALSMAHSGRQVIANFVTNDQPSPTRDKEASTSLAEFVHEALPSFHAIANHQVPCDGLWPRAVAATGLSDEEARQFFASLRLHFAVGTFRQLRLDTSMQSFPSADVEVISAYLLRRAEGSSPSLPVDISAQDFIRDLGWKDRLTTRSHRFHLDRARYVRIADQSAALTSALQTVRSGYVAVIGGPGSGKSSLLTDVLAREEYGITLRYYGFLNDELPADRGESKSFFSDLLRMLQKVDPHAQIPAVMPRELAEVRRQFWSAVQSSAQRLAQHDRRLVILVDGLDHIDREQRPERSLLRELPSPSSLPDGVVVVLGSQRIDLPDISTSIIEQLREPGRIVEMRGLTRTEIGAVAKAALRVDLTSELLSLLTERSQGHPLTLQYLLHEVRELATADEVLRVVSTSPVFTGDISASYAAHWAWLSADGSLTQVLGVVCRLFGPINLKLLEEWFGSDVIDSLRGRARPYFLADGDVWHFFHNSFRQYLLRKTQERPDGTVDPERGVKIHAALAERARRCTGPYAWNAISHAVEGNLPDLVLELATIERWRSQLLDYRSGSSIRNDIRSAFDIAAASGDDVRLLRLLVADAELTMRAENLSSSLDLPLLLLAVGEVSRAITLLHSGRRLYVSEATALKAVEELLKLQMPQAAANLFDIAQPTAFITRQPVAWHDLHDGQLERWAKLAIHFLPIDQVVAAIGGVTVESADSRTLASNERTAELRARLLAEAGEALIEAQKDEPLELVIQALHDLGTFGQGYEFKLRHALCVRYRLSDDKDGAFKQLTLLRLIPQNVEQRVLLAEEHFRWGDRDVAAELIRGIEHPSPDRDFAAEDGAQLGRWAHAFRLSRLKWALGSSEAIEAIVPDTSPEPHRKLLVRFVRSLHQLSRIWASAWRGARLDSASFVKRLELLFRLFDEHPPGLEWYRITSNPQALRVEFVEIAIEYAARFDPAALGGICDWLDTQWKRTVDIRRWSHRSMRAVCLKLHQVSGDSTWSNKWLDAISAEMDEIEDNSADIEGHVQALSKFDRLADAKAWARRAVEAGRGPLHEKDDQLAQWVHLLKCSFEGDRDAAKQAAQRMVRRLEAVSSAGYSLRYLDDAWDDLIGWQWSLSPVDAVNTVLGLRKDGVVQHFTLLNAILRAAASDPSTSPELLVNVYIDFLIGHSQYLDQATARSVMARARRSMSQEERSKFLCRCREVIETRIPSDQRVQALACFAQDAFECGLEWPNPGDEVGRAAPEPDARRQRERTDEAPLTALSGEELAEAYINRSRHADCDWANVIGEFLRTRTQEDSRLLLKRLAAAGHASSDVDAALRQLVALGRGAEAAAFAEHFLTNKSFWSWSRSPPAVDGKEPDALGILLEASPSKARAIVVSRLRAAIGSGDVGGLWPLLYLTEYSDVFKPVAILKALRDDFECYLDALAGSERESLPYDAASIIFPADATADRALLQLVVVFVGDPVHVLHRAAVACLIRQLANKSAVAIDAVRFALLQSNVESRLGLLECIESAQLVTPDVPKAFQAELTAIPSQNCFFMTCALSRLGAEPDVQRERQPTSQCLTPDLSRLVVVLPESLEGRRSQRPADEPLPDTDAPNELFRAYLPHVEALSKLTGIEIPNLLYRATSILQSRFPASTWNEDAERQYRGWLERLQLRQIFTRPRATRVQAAFSQLVLEVVGDPSLKKEREFCEKLMRRFDPALNVSLPSKRPVSIVQPLGFPTAREQVAAWIEKCSPLAGMPRPDEHEEWIVLGEHTRSIQRFDVSVEERISWALVYPRLNQSVEPFDAVGSRLVAEHGVSSSDEPTSPLIYNGGTLLNADERSHWIGMNPNLALQMGWVSDDKRLLWRDHDCTIAAWSIYWIDGNEQLYPLERCATCWGYRTVVSAAGYQMLTASFGTPSTIRSKCERYGEVGQENVHRVSHGVSSI